LTHKAFRTDWRKLLAIADKFRPHIFIIAAVMVNAALFLSVISCSITPVPPSVSSQALLLQVELRKQQIAAPTDQRLEQMKSMSMLTDNLTAQRVYIYMNDMATPEQEEELTEMGVKIYSDSWVPPLANIPLGFYIAELPYDKVKELAAKDYVVKLDTAEQKASPRCGL
jgi:hypothetical protein